MNVIITWVCLDGSKTFGAVSLLMMRYLPPVLPFCFWSSKINCPVIFKCVRMESGPEKSKISNFARLFTLTIFCPCNMPINLLTENRFTFLIFDTVPGPKCTILGALTMTLLMTFPLILRLSSLAMVWASGSSGNWKTFDF